MRIPDGELEAACKKAAGAAVDFLLEVASGYRDIDAQAGMMELTALLVGQREAVLAGATARAFQAMAEALDPEMFQEGGDGAGKQQ